MKNLRIEVQVLVKVYAGDDVPADGELSLNRFTDALERVSMARVVSVRELREAHDIAPEHLATILGNAAPVMGERLAHSLRVKGL